MERGNACFVHICLWVQCNFAVHWHIAAFFNNHFHHKELDIEWAKPEQSSFLHLYSENTHVSEEHWKKAWKDSEVLSLTITRFLPCSVGRSLNLGCRNWSQVFCSLFLCVSVHKESKTGEANHKTINHLDQANQMTKGCRMGCRLNKRGTNSSITLLHFRGVHLPGRKERNLFPVTKTLIS